MGYTTTFEGKMTLAPALTAAQTQEIEDFCEARHGGNLDVYNGYPTFWCNWQTNGKKLYWSGAEKSYDMEKWLQILIDRFFKPWGVKVTGKMLAQGENPNDRWTMEVGEDQKVVVKRFTAVDMGVTY
jgi:hypothetical protein